MCVCVVWGGCEGYYTWVLVVVSRWISVSGCERSFSGSGASCVGSTGRVGRRRGSGREGYSGWMKRRVEEVKSEVLAGVFVSRW